MRDEGRTDSSFTPHTLPYPDTISTPLPMPRLQRNRAKRKKISANFLAYVSRTLDPMGLSPADPRSEFLMKLCRATWNAVVFADFVGKTDDLDALLDPNRLSPDTVVLVKKLVKRKRSRRFADDDRLIGAYQFKIVGSEPRIRVEAGNPYPKDQTAS